MGTPTWAHCGPQPPRVRRPQRLPYPLYIQPPQPRLFSSSQQQFSEKRLTAVTQSGIFKHPHLFVSGCKRNHPAHFLIRLPPPFRRRGGGAWWLRSPSAWSLALPAALSSGAGSVGFLEGHPLSAGVKLSQNQNHKKTNPFFWGAFWI